MNALMGTLVAWLGPSLPGAKRGGAAGGSGSDLPRLLHPSVPLTILMGTVVALVAIALLSAALSTMAWAESRKNGDIRSVGRTGSY